MAIELRLKTGLRLPDDLDAEVREILHWRNEAAVELEHILIHGESPWPGRGSQPPQDLEGQVRRAETLAMSLLSSYGGMACTYKVGWDDTLDC